MPNESFPIESYRITADPRGYFTYVLSFTSEEMFHGTRSRAFVFFVPESDLPSTPVIIPRGSEDLAIYALADETYFETMYHILQTEDPLSFTYGYRSGESRTRQLYDFYLTTADEPPGEGLTERGLRILIEMGELSLEEMDADEFGVEGLDALRSTEDFATGESTSQ